MCSVIIDDTIKTSKSAKVVPKVKGQGQMSPESNNFWGHSNR